MTTPAVVSQSVVNAEAAVIFRHHPSVKRIRIRCLGDATGTTYLCHLVARRRNHRTLVNAWLDVTVKPGQHRTIILRDLTGYVKLPGGYYARVTTAE